MNNSKIEDFYFGISDSKIYICYFDNKNYELKNTINFDIPGSIDNNLNFFISDIWNYGSSELHYYNFGGSYSIGRTRLSANYGRQRGGLICVGGVCRYVPESNGYNLSLSYSF